MTNRIQLATSKPKGNTCGQCEHWLKQPANPMNLGARPLGMCFGMPPTPICLGLAEGGTPILTNVRSSTPDNERACGQFQIAQDTPQGVI
jgi:hypothetical protein